MIHLENEQVIVKIKEMGAELTSVLDRATAYEFIWQGDPNYWGRQAPILFPIVGSLKEGAVSYQGQDYRLPRHGFARDSYFRVIAQSQQAVTFELTSNDETKNLYPFDFVLQVSYILSGRRLTVSYTVHNPHTSQVLYYNIGGHPAFNVCHNDKEEFDGVWLSFQPQEMLRHIPLDVASGLIELNKARYQELSRMELSHKTFKKDALIYQIKPEIELLLEDAQASIGLSHHGMTFVGIWSPYPVKAPFVCLEPWAGIADSSETSGQWPEKYQVIEVGPSNVSTHDYTLTFTKKN